MNENNFWNFALQSLSENKNIVLMIVADSSNSSPGRQGFKMLIDEDGNSKGTIGGGIREKWMSDFSLDFMSSGRLITIKQLQHSESDKFESSGLICGGFQTIIFINLDKSHQLIIKDIIENNRKAVLYISHQSFNLIDYQNSMSDIQFKYESENLWSYQEVIGNYNSVYIIGGGHVGKAVSELMKMLGFYVVIFDHRESVFTMTENNAADKKIICDYDEVGQHIIENDKAYIVICTSKHTGDKTALMSVIKKQVSYIGMMGSKRKVKTIFNEIKAAGFSEELLNKVHSPIGLEIKSETPEEIAVSIAAEIIKIKNEKKYV